MRRGPGASRHCESEAIENHRDWLKTIIGEPKQSLVFGVFWVITKAETPIPRRGQAANRENGVPRQRQAVREPPLPDENRRQAG